MKFILFFVISSFTFSNSQKELDFPPKKYGINIGTNLAFFTDIEGPTGPKPGFKISGFGEHYLGDIHGLRAQMGYNSYKSGYEHTLNGKTFDVSGELSYINLGVSYFFNPASFFYLSTGLNVGFLLSSKSSGYEEITSGTARQIETDLKDTTNETRFGIPLKLGMPFSIGDTELSPTLGFEIGLSKIYTTNDQDIKLNALEISIDVKI